MSDLENKRRSMKINKLPILLVILVIVGVGFLSFKYFFGPNNNGISNISNTNAVVTHVYTSDKLGVRFTYADQDLGKRILIQEVGEKVFVHYQDTPASEGQFVQVFSKDPNDTLQQAIEKKFLQGYRSTDCYVKSGTDISGKLTDTGISAIIAFPISENANDSGLENASKCPKVYSLTNGLSYFWTDTENSSKMVFFSIGQYYIPSTTEGTSWHTTLQFDPSS